MNWDHTIYAERKFRKRKKQVLLEAVEIGDNYILLLVDIGRLLIRSSASSIYSIMYVHMLSIKEKPMLFHILQMLLGALRIYDY